MGTDKFPVKINMKRITLEFLFWVSFVLLLYLTGCAGVSQHYKEVMDDMLGKRVEYAMERMGPPAQIQKLPDTGNTVYTWIRGGGGGTTGANFAYPGGRTSSGYSYSSQYYCKTSFFVDEHHIVQQWFAEGNICR